MRARLAAIGLSALAGCSLLVDTGDLDDDATDGALADGGPTTLVDGAPTAVDAGHSDAALDAGSNDAAVDADAEPTLPRIVGDWPFSEGSGTTIGDVSGRNHHGLVFGTGGWIADHVDAAASAYELRSNSDYIAVAGGTDFSRPAATSFSMSAWARSSDPPDHDMFFSVSFGDNSASFGIELESPTVITYFDGKDHIARSDVPDVVGAWHHYAIVVDGNQARVYFDGIKVGSGSPDTAPRPAIQVLFGRSTYGDRLNGAIDKARFFRVALTDAEVMVEKNR